MLCKLGRVDHAVFKMVALYGSGSQLRRRDGAVLHNGTVQAFGCNVFDRNASLSQVLRSDSIRSDRPRRHGV